MANSSFKLFPHQEAFIKILEDQPMITPQWLPREQIVGRMNRVGMPTPKVTYYDAYTTTYADIKKILDEKTTISQDLIDSVTQTMHDMLDKPLVEALYGVNIKVVPSWVSGWRWTYHKQPPVPPRGQRKGTRKQWKRANPQGWRCRWGAIEPDHVIRAGDWVYCTPRQYELIKQGTMPL